MVTPLMTVLLGPGWHISNMVTAYKSA